MADEAVRVFAASAQPVQRPPPIKLCGAAHSKTRAQGEAEGAAHSRDPNLPADRGTVEP